jgi:hypothetical protein
MYKPKASPLLGKPNAPQSKQTVAGQPFRPVSLGSKTAPTPKQPAAPPVYRPQSAPRTLQAKASVPKQSPPLSQSKYSPKAPPVYRPQSAPRVLQSKQATSLQRQVAKSEKLPGAPPAYRPMPTPKVLQTKQANVRPTPALRSMPPARPQQTPKVAQAKMLPGQQPAERLRATQVSSQGRYTIQMVPVRVGRDIYDTKHEGDTQLLANRLNEMFRRDPNSRDLTATYRDLQRLPRHMEQDELENTLFIRDTLLGGMLNTDDEYRLQIRTLRSAEWQSASVRVYVDGREVGIRSWRHSAIPGGVLEYHEKREKGREDKQSAVNLKDEEGFQKKVTKGEKRDMQVSVEDAEAKVIAELEKDMATPQFLHKLHAAKRDVYIRFVSFLGACNACKTRIQVLLQRIRAEVPRGIEVSLSFFYQEGPKEKTRGKDVRTFYGWAEDVESRERGFGGLYIHDYPTVRGTWEEEAGVPLHPPRVSSSSSVTQDQRH